MRSLPRARREAIFAVYAFCRMVDDIADSEGLPKNQQRALLDAWRAEVERVYVGAPISAIGHALQDAKAHFDLPQNEFFLMLDGMLQDVDGPIVAPSMDDLLVYTRRVAGSVGKLSIRIFGARDCAERDDFALALADGLQLTNILRDVEEDAGIGRVYLPQELLAAHGLSDLTQDDLLRVLADGHPALPAICTDLGHVARLRLHEARKALPALKRASVRPALMMLGVYEGYLDRMEAAGFARDAESRTMPRWQKLARSLRYAYAPPKRSAPTEGSMPLSWWRA